MDEWFEVLGTAESVPRRKPHPDIFLYVAVRLGIAAKECIALDDAEQGVIAAHEAGMRSVAVPTAHTMTNDFSRASLVVNSLSEVTLARLEQLAQ